MMEVKKTPAAAVEYKNLQPVSNRLISNIVARKSDNENVDKLCLLLNEDSEMKQNEEIHVKDVSGSDKKVIQQQDPLKNISGSKTSNKDSILSEEFHTEVTLKDDTNHSLQNIDKIDKPELLVQDLETSEHMKDEKLQGKENSLRLESTVNPVKMNEIINDKIEIDPNKTEELLCEMAKDNNKLNEESMDKEKSEKLIQEPKSAEYNLEEFADRHDSGTNVAVGHSRQSSENKTETDIVKIDESSLIDESSKTIQISADSLATADQSDSDSEKIEDCNVQQNTNTDNKDNKTEESLNEMRDLLTNSSNSKALETNLLENLESTESQSNLEQDHKSSHIDHNTNKTLLSSPQKSYVSTFSPKDELSIEKCVEATHPIKDQNLKENINFETPPSKSFKEKESKDSFKHEKNSDTLPSQFGTSVVGGVSRPLLTGSKSPLVDGDIINLDSPLPEDERDDTKEDTEVKEGIKQIENPSMNSSGTEEKFKEVAQTNLKSQEHSEDDDDVVMLIQKTKTDNSDSDEDVVIVEKKTERCTELKKSASTESIAKSKDDDEIFLLDDIKEQTEDSVSIEKKELHNKKLQDSDEMQVEEEIFSFDTRLGDRQKNDTEEQEEDDDDVVLLECVSDKSAPSHNSSKKLNTLTTAEDNSGCTGIEEKYIKSTTSYIADLSEVTTVAATVSDSTKNVEKNEIVDLDLEDEKLENDKKAGNEKIVNKSNKELIFTSRDLDGKVIQELPKTSEIVELDSEKEDEQVEPEFKPADEQIIEPSTKLSILVSDNSDNAQDKFPENLLAIDSKSRDSENLLQATDSPQNSRSNDVTITSKAGAEISNLEGSAEPPLKRARVEKITEKGPQSLVDAKENSFEGSVSPDPLFQESKKLKLFHEDNLSVKSMSGKLEDNHIFKAKSIRNEKLEPTPQASKKVDVKLDFLRRFKKSITEMTKADLEELVLQKVVEAIVYKSEFSEMREMIEKQEATITTHRTKLTEITKQFRDLEMVHNRVLKDLETKNQQFIMPVKITRAVGLQVLIPKRIDQAGMKSSVPATASQQINMQSSSNVLHSAKRRSASKVVPCRPEVASQQASSRNTPTAPINIAQKVDSSSPQNKPIIQHRVVNRNTVALPSQNVNQLSLAQSAQTQYIVQQSQIGQASSTHQMTLKKSAPLVRTQQPPVIQKSPVSQNAADRRVPPMILKKTSANGRILTVASPDSVTPPVTTVQNSSLVAPGSKSVIDLTDEDDGSSKITSSATLPALVAIPNHAISTRVTYVVNQANTTIPSQRLSITQNGATAQKMAKTKTNPQFVTIAPKPPLNTPLVASTSARLPATTILRRHPAPLPKAPASISNPSWKNPPPRPSICISNDERGIVISWTMDDMNEKHAEVTSYQIYAYQETNAVPAVEAWRHVGDVKAMLLPMAVTLTQFQEGQRYYFAVRAVDTHTRCGPFSMPITWT